MYVFTFFLLLGTDLKFVLYKFFDRFYKTNYSPQPGKSVKNFIPTFCKISTPIMIDFIHKIIQLILIYMNICNVFKFTKRQREKFAMQIF